MKSFLSDKDTTTQSPVRIPGKRLSQELRLTFVFIYIVCFIGGVQYAVSRPFLPSGPGARVAETARWIWTKGNIERPEFKEVYQTLVQKSREAPRKTFWQDVFAVGANGELYPKHALICSLTAAPLYGLFGDFGFWLFNQLALFALLAGLYRVCRELSTAQTATAVVCMFCLSSLLFPIYSYTLSYDLHAAALLVLGCSLLVRRPVLGMFLCAMSLYIRVSNLTYLPFFVGAWWIRFEDKRRATRSILAGFLLAAIPLAMLNYYFWGNPFHSAYQHLPDFKNGEPVLGHREFFAFPLITHDLVDKMFGLQYGYLTYNPFLFLMPFVIPKALAFRDRSVMICLFGAALFSVVILFGYSMADSAGLGNRYLLPATALFGVVYVPFFESMQKRKQEN